QAFGADDEILFALHKGFPKDLPPPTGHAPQRDAPARENHPVVDVPQCQPRHARGALRKPITLPRYFIACAITNTSADTVTARPKLTRPIVHTVGSCEPLSFSSARSTRSASSLASSDSSKSDMPPP